MTISEVAGMILVEAMAVVVTFAVAVASWGYLRGVLGCLGASWGALGGFLGASSAVLGRPGGVPLLLLFRPRRLGQW